MVGYDPWHWDEEETKTMSNKICKDPKGHCDDGSTLCPVLNCYRIHGFCDCEHCDRRRVRKNEARKLEEDRLQAKWDARRNRAVATGVSFLLPTIGQRAWSLVKALLFGGSCVAAVEVVKAWL